MDTFAVPNRQTSSGAAVCPSCGGTATETIYRVRSIPLHSCVLLSSAEAARSFPRRDLELAFCPDCGFAFNAIFDEAAMAYSTEFEESQHFSGTFNAFARLLAAEVAATCDATGKQIMEIGCGKGEFLDQLCEIADASGLGIDPAYRADPGRTSDSGRVRFLPELFGPQHAELSADVIVCRHTLEHIAPVQSFLAAIRQMVGSRRDVRVFFETPDFARVLREGAFWDIYYEHCSYFSAGSHADLFARAGFSIDEVKLAFDGQYIIQYASPAETSRPLPYAHAVDEMRDLARGFSERVRRSQETWRKRVQRSHREGRGVVLWGGGSKAVSFLTTLGLGPEVQAAVDINPYKQGKFTPGTAHPVIAPEALPELCPGTVIVMNPIYVSEVRNTLDSLGLAPELLSL